MLLFEVKGLRLNDNWYCEDNGVYHTYFLEYPENAPLDGRHWSEQTVGHAVSSDLIHWEYKGTVLTADKNCWNDKGIATGSVVKFDGKWYMLYSGNSTKDAGGLGLAVSENLQNWQRVGNAPVIDRNVLYDFELNGETIKVKMLADPYIYPETFDGYFYAYINAVVDGCDINDSAVQAIMKSKDLINWEPHKIACRDACNRIETSQIWPHGDKWYMYGGAVTYPNGIDYSNQISKNIIYVSDKCDEGFKRLCEIDMDENFYIAKMVYDKQGREVVFANDIPRGIIGPYFIEYGENEVKLVK